MLNAAVNDAMLMKTGIVKAWVKDETLRETDAYKRAMELGIAVLTERQLSLFLRY